MAADTVSGQPVAGVRESETGSVDSALSRAELLLERSPPKAALQAAEILRAVPGHPQAVLILGAARRLQGDSSGALAMLAPLARAQPRSARTQHELGLALAALGDHTRAIEALRRALALKPELSGAWQNLGDLLLLADDPAGADAAYARHIATAVHDPLLMQAGAALCEGRLDIAERLLRTHLKEFPTDVAALRMLAETGTRLGRYEDAEKLLARCLELAPGFAAARHHYAIVLFRQSKAAEAIPHLEQLFAAAPRDAGVRNLLAASLAIIGDAGRAIELFESVLRDYPNQPKIWLSYGHALRTAGRREDCLRAYRRCLALAPGFGEAYWSLANLKTAPFSADDIDVLRRLLQRDDLEAEDRYHLEYALGRALEDARAFEESFQHYTEGARLRRAEISYDAQQTSSQVCRAQALFTRAFFVARAGYGDQSREPIFVIGLPRSGSTLIEQILSSHSRVQGTMELPEITAIARDLRKRDGEISGYPERLDGLDGEECARLGRRFLDRTRIYRRSGKPFFIDKMPNNWAHVGLIHLILPNAKIIDARRHPMATCFSAFKQHFARGQHYTYDLRELGRYYCDYVSLMAHFDTVLPGRIHRVVYEDMVADTEHVVRRMLTYCGLAFEPACLRFYHTARAVRTASSEQVRQPIFREGLDQWRNFAAWLGPLEDEVRRGALPLDPAGAVAPRPHCL